MKKTKAALILSLILAVSSGCLPSRAAEEPIELSFLTSGTGNAAEEIREDLEAQIQEDFPNVSISVEAYPDEQFYSILNTRLSTGNGPDFFSVQPYLAGPNGVQKLADAGYMEPLNDLSIIQNASEEQTAPMSSDGNVYSLSRFEMILCTYYNEDLFAQYHLSVPTNWQEFLDCCAVLKSNGIQPLISGNKDSFVLQFGIYQIAASQVYAKNPDYNAQLYTGETRFTNPGTWDEAIRRYLLLYDEGYVQPHSLKIGQAEALERFADGEAAMMMGGNFNDNTILDAIDGRFSLKSFPLPGNDEGEPLYGVISKTGGYAIYSQSEHLDLCKQILEKLYGNNDEEEENELFQAFDSLRENGQFTVNCNQGWQGDVEWALEDGLSRYIGGDDLSVHYITNQMQEQLQKNET